MINDISKERLMALLTDLVSFDSVSGARETGIEQYVYDFIRKLPYFRKYKAHCGFYPIPGDPFGRAVPYGLVLGKQTDTVILSGHLDVVSAKVYGNAEPLAFKAGTELEAALSQMNLTEEQRQDLESGEWIWGRGTADMKAGIAMGMLLLELYAERACAGEPDPDGCGFCECPPEGSYLFLAVADEESYSAGMRAVLPLLAELKGGYGLRYRLLINPEPAAVRQQEQSSTPGQDSTPGQGGQVVSLGSIGKTMPVIVTQGVPAHMGKYYDGISALNMLTGIYRRTNGSFDFVDTYEGEASIPPVWLAMRDLKDSYDVSLPYRAYGCISMLNFDTSFGEIIAALKKIAIEIFEEEVLALADSHRAYRHLRGSTAPINDIRYDTCVYTVAELCEALSIKSAAFDEFRESLYRQASERVTSGDSYQDATVFMMTQLLDHADLKGPAILIGAAPPYYPASHSDKTTGNENFGTKVFEHIRKVSEQEYGQPLSCEHYFTGISDNSYTAYNSPSGSGGAELHALAANCPLWGSLYDIDFGSMATINVPAILYGPIGKEYHQRTERVNKRSFLEIMPAMLQHAIGFAWRK